MSVTLHTTMGNMKIEVFCESVPKTAEVSIPTFSTFHFLTKFHPQNFMALCASSGYNSSPFHRCIPQFMIQTGSPANQGPKVSTSIWYQDFEDEIRPSLRHNTRGIVSMANKGPGTNGSQFFVLFAAAPHLDGKNTVFGRVIGDEGMETISKMEELETDKKGRPKEKVMIERVSIHANPLAG